MKVDNKIKNVTLSAMFLALGMILPMFTGQIPQIGSMLLPMHIPVFLCAFICGWKFGVPVAIILPILRSVLFGRPNLYPEAIAIACEMATYALVVGILYIHLHGKEVKRVYISLLIAMILGRLVRGIVQLALLGLSGTPFAFATFFSGTILAGVPGIIIQLVLIPAVMMAFSNVKKERRN